jgi:hypothetical protein
MRRWCGTALAPFGDLLLGNVRKAFSILHEIA